MGTNVDEGWGIWTNSKSPPIPTHPLNSTDCSSFEQYTVDSMLVGGVGMSLVSLVGIVGNCLTIIVLSRPTLRSSSTNVILLSLGTCDLVVVTLNPLLYAVDILLNYFCIGSYYLAVVDPIIFCYLFGLSELAYAGSIYFTVVVTIERVIVVYRPLLARSLCTVRNARWATLVVATFCILFSLPRWFEYSCKDKYDADGNWSGYANVRARKIEDDNSAYMVYYVGWSRIFVYRLIPVTLLVILNSLIYKKIREVNQTRTSMTRRSPDSSENSVTKMLVWVVSIFIGCHSVSFYLGLVLAFHLEDAPSILYRLGTLLVNLNSAVNFIIYCLVGHKFRQTCAHLFRLRRTTCSRRPTDNDNAHAVRPTSPVTLQNAFQRPQQTRATV